MRRFAPVKDAPSDTVLPKRGSKFSAGYDFYAPKDIIDPAKGMSELVFMNVKAYMPSNEYLAVMIRSSLAVKYGLQVAQGIAVIDSDYVDNESNDGNIGICFVNNSDSDYVIEKGERCCQGVFCQYAVTCNDVAAGERRGGYGSTGK